MEKNISKRLRNEGKQYEDAKGRLRRPRCLADGCTDDCSFKCNENFNEKDRQKIHKLFWSLTASDKLGFFSKFTRKVPKGRQRTKNVNSRRQGTFLYYFQKQLVSLRVCKVFFLKTLDISQNRIYHFYKTKSTEFGTHTPSQHGNHIKFKIPEEKINQVKDHIKSFPIMDSHYCRANSTRQYLETGLTINRMYSLYMNDTNDPVKLNIYKKVFNKEFNLSFFKPKKDQCDRCVAFNLITNPSPSEKQNFEVHQENNQMAKANRNADRNLTDPLTAVICYDLQNVFSLPRAEVSNFFYRRKFSVYNLTAHSSLNKITYCAIWHEAMSGRTGNDLASSLIKILEQFITDNPTVHKIILWSDSCIPQNRNRITTLAILKFMEKHSHIVEIQQKFSAPGHSQVQEIDAVHSTIEKYMRHSEIYSPVGLIRKLLNMNYTKVKLKVLQMGRHDFKNYNAASIGLIFPPFASTANLIYEQSNLTQVKYRKEHGKEILTTCIIKLSDTRKNVSKRTVFKLPNVGACIYNYKMPLEKKKDIRSMLCYMPETDKQFYSIYLK